ncbi:hypothetical protein N658DRAFT_45973 [Parathielavia hyrcaniae]|uniref:Uncharacterized protein n=1 Tax=Parathielavia hyrcaniae TaxID=113614 RepID=A0AAN6PQU3_9PEZI|nr:hypothetical protein N658DRAFT_45973 [Parathielavia hyrcaniae]
MRSPKANSCPCSSFYMYRTVGNPRLFLLETRPTWRILLGMEAARQLRGSKYHSLPRLTCPFRARCIGEGVPCCWGTPAALAATVALGSRPASE